MKWLVTGVAGFIGSQLGERLIADDHTVVGDGPREEVAWIDAAEVAGGFGDV